MDFTIIHRIEAPELVAALNNLSDALRNDMTITVSTNPVPAPAPAPAVEIPATVTENPIQDSVIQQNVQTQKSGTGDAGTAMKTPVQSPDVAADTAPALAPVPAPVPAPAPVPVPAPTPAPAQRTYTFEDVTNGGGQLMDQGKMADLMGLLKQHGVQAVTQLKPEQYESVCAGLVKLGAKI